MGLLTALDRLADVAGLDRLVVPVQGAVTAALRGQALRDALHGAWLGHPLHPVLVQVPLGTWLSAGVLDLLPGTRPAARALIGAGVAASLPAAMTGAADWAEQDAGVRRLGVLHAGANVLAVCLFSGSLAARQRGATSVGMVLSYAGLALVGASATVGTRMSALRLAGTPTARPVPGEWVDLGPLDDLPEGRPARRTGLGDDGVAPLAVVRRGGRVDVLLGVCAHRGGPLHEGTVADVDGRACLVCPWHGSAFDLDGGIPRRGPAGVPQEVLEVRREAGHALARLPARDLPG